MDQDHGLLREGAYLTLFVTMIAYWSLLPNWLSFLFQDQS